MCALKFSLRKTYERLMKAYERLRTDLGGEENAAGKSCILSYVLYQLGLGCRKKKYSSYFTLKKLIQETRSLQNHWQD